MDWIDDFLSETTLMPAPEPFRLWSAITAISGALERKVWTNASGGPIYPNLYTLLVGVPASGKSQAIDPVRNLWARTELKISPDNLTKASLIDTLSKSSRMGVSRDGSMATNFNALCVQCSEFGVFFVNHDLSFISVLNRIYDNPDIYEEQRIIAGNRKIEKPTMIILAGTQPDYLSAFMPEEAWGMGFASRLIMIYAEKPDSKASFFRKPNGHDWIAKLSQPLNRMMTLYGGFYWHPKAQEKFEAWHEKDCPGPIIDHPKLRHYVGRRNINIVKLSMIAAASRDQEEMQILPQDLERAFHWLFTAEHQMPEIFTAMSHKSDINLLKEFNAYFYELYLTRNRKALDETELCSYLANKVPVERIGRIMEIAVKTGVIRRAGMPESWIPRQP